jgi:hypothetical protein
MPRRKERIRTFSTTAKECRRQDDANRQMRKLQQFVSAFHFNSEWNYREGQQSEKVGELDGAGPGRVLLFQTPWRWQVRGVLPFSAD